MQQAVFRTLFVIEHEVDGDPRAVGPLRCGWRATVADEVAGIVDSPGHIGARGEPRSLASDGRRP